MPEPLPALRALDIFPMEHEGEQLFCMSDPSGVVEEQLLLSPPAVFIAVHLNGRNSEEHIQAAFLEQSDGMPLPVEHIEQVLQHLDSVGFLETPTFYAIHEQLRADFRDSPKRPAYLAGKSYPEDPEELRAFLDEQFKREDSPAEALPETPGTGTPLPGLIVPHIDLHRGGHSYAHGYLELYKSGTPDTVFIFGVAHAAERVPFILTRKHFETPLGTLEADLEFIDRIAAACDWDPYEHELTHRTEHSIEFQAMMLAYLYGPNVKIVPILCSMFSEDPACSDPGSLAPVQQFLSACQQAIQESEKQVTVIAGADLAHVGKRFGDPFDIDETIVQGVADRDHEDLAFVHTLEPEAFYASVMKDLNQRHTCGYAPIYSALKSINGTGLTGRPLHYDYAHDPAGGIVSFASIAIT